MPRHHAAPTREAADGEPMPREDGGVFEDAYAALLTVGLNPVDARNRLDHAAASGKPFKTVEDVLNVIFRKE